MPDLSVALCGVTLKNPVIAASGTYAFGREFDKFYDISLLGGISVKGLTRLPREGNAPHRIAETPSGILNCVGLQNPGVDAFIADELPWLRQRDVVVVANMAGSTVEDYAYMAARLSAAQVDILEMNISCPNVKNGTAFGSTPQGVYEATRAARREATRPLMVKLSPNVTSIADCARAAQDAGADAVSLINTITGMAVDVYSRRPVLSNITGGLSGPAVRPVALRMVYEAARAVSIPVVGMGGIMTGEDVAAFMLCGATAVMVGSANIFDPMAAPRIVDELAEYCCATGTAAVSELTGGLKC